MTIRQITVRILSGERFGCKVVVDDLYLHSGGYAEEIIKRGHSSSMHKMRDILMKKKKRSVYHIQLYVLAFDDMHLRHFTFRDIKDLLCLA